MRTYNIVDEATGQVVATQTWNDDIAPHLQPGQRSIQEPAGAVAIREDGATVPVADVNMVGQFTKQGASEPVELSDNLDVVISGEFTGLVQLECSTDGGVHWASVQDEEQGIPVAWTEPGDLAWGGVERGLYRLNCITLENGTVEFTLGDGSDMEVSDSNQGQSDPNVQINVNQPASGGNTGGQGSSNDPAQDQPQDQAARQDQAQQDGERNPSNPDGSPQNADQDGAQDDAAAKTAEGDKTAQPNAPQQG